MKKYCAENLPQKENHSDEAAQKEDQKDDPEFNTFVYSKEDDYYTYELVGVVVHNGIVTASHLLFLYKC
jgi:hypothetical protein